MTVDQTATSGGYCWDGVVEWSMKMNKGLRWTGDNWRAKCRKNTR